MFKQLIKLNKFYLYVIPCVLLIYNFAAHAKQSDKQAPIKIWADTFFANKKSNLATYSGNVKFQQGTIKIHCDLLKIVYQQTNVDEIDYITMQAKKNTDTFARFEQINDDNQLIKASAKNIKYTQIQNIITFNGNAELQQSNNVFRAESMLFDANESRLISNKTTDDAEKNRVFISIKPEKQ